MAKMKNITKGSLRSPMTGTTGMSMATPKIAPDVVMRGTAPKAAKLQSPNMTNPKP